MATHIGSKCCQITALAALLVATVAWAGDPVPDVDVILEQIPGGMLRADSATGGFDEVWIQAGKEIAKAARPVALPAGWTLEVDGQQFGLSGPELPAGQPVRFKLDIGSTPRPKRISYEVILEGRTLLRRRNEQVDLVAPQAVIGSLQGIVTLPTQVAPGGPMQIRVTDPSALPAGGTWLSGTVVADEEPTEPENDDGPGEPVVAVFTARGDVDFVDPSFATEFPVGYSRIVRFAAELTPSISEGSSVQLTIHTDGSLDWEPSELAPSAKTAEALLLTEPTEADSTKDMLARQIPWCRWWRPIPPQCRKRPEPDPPACPNGIPNCPNHPAVGLASADGIVTFVLSEGLRPGDSLAMQYTDIYGDVVLDVPSVPGVEVVEPGAYDAGARITGATSRVLAGELACVCGSFPTPAAWNGLLLNGEPMEAPVSASSLMAWVTFPSDLVPGDYVFSGAPELGFPATDRATTQVVAVNGELDSSKLKQLQTTPMRLWVVGTDQPVDLRVRNFTPSIISIEGGADQVIPTSGGTSNMLERVVKGLAPGAFDIKFELAGEDCPCAASTPKAP